MRDTFLRFVSDDDRNLLYEMMEWNDKESSYRVKIILLRDKGYTVPEIRKATNHHDINIRKWIHRYNEQGIEGITSKIHKHKSLKITSEIEEKIVEIATRNPRDGYGLPFSTWSLRLLAGYVSKELKLVDSISHTEIRNILLKHRIRYRQSKITLGNSTDPEYHLKKRGLKN
ncbi:MAG TPA: helix-turn-helix domain-containing protein [Bacillus sp. (in: firmicutes)]|jgi:transposase|nr:helix-turn-helix domain-containing protein [Bacillus sp. (in: firmicutes)]